MRRGDIVLIKFPFSDLSSNKVRPALIVSSDKYVNRGSDAIFIFISSNTTNPQHTDLILDQSDLEFTQTGLRKSSLIKTEKIMNLSKSLASRFLGEAGPNIMRKINEMLISVLDLN